MWVFLISNFRRVLNTPGYEDGTDRVFRNVGIYNSDAGELPKRKHNICGSVSGIARSLTQIKFLYID